MNSNKSSGPDHARALKELKYEITKLLTVLCRLALKMPVIGQNKLKIGIWCSKSYV